MLVKRKSQCITRSIWFTLYWGSQVSNTGNVQERFANIKMHWGFRIKVIKKDNFCKLIDQFKSFASLLLVGFELHYTFLGGEEKKKCFTRWNVWYFGFLNIPSSSREGPEAGFRSYGERISRTGSFAVFAGTAWGEWSVRTASSDGDLIKSAFPLIAFTLLLNIKVLPPSHPKFIGHTIGSAYDKIFFLGGGRIFLLDLKIQRFS